jgi:multidrug efflux pump subunit AcrA (membrane-fusion protein)
MKYTGFYILIFLSLFSCKEKAEWVKPINAPITESVFASGHIEPVQQFMLTSISEGYLQRAFVREDDVVEAGQLLFMLDNRSTTIEETASEKNLQLAIQNASPNSPTLGKLKNDLASAQQKLAVDSLQYARLKRLFETNTVAKIELDNARLAYENGVNTVKAIRENINATHLNLQQALIQAQSQYQTSVTGNTYFSLKSPDHLKVYQVLKKQGELVRKGEAVSLLGHPDSLSIVLMVDETAISKIQLQQKVLIELNTLKGKAYMGHVSRIYPYFDQESQAYKVEAFFDEMPKGLIAGTLLQANIIVDHKENAMLIPRASLSPEGEVVVNGKNGNKTVKINAGIISTEWVEILGGINKEDEVLKVF